MAQNPVRWFEIYVQDVNRAKRFYETVFNVKLERLNSPGAEMWSFPPYSRLCPSAKRAGLAGSYAMSYLMADLGEDVSGKCLTVGQVGIVGMVDGPLRFFGPGLVLQRFHQGVDHSRIDLSPDAEGAQHLGP